MLLLVYDYMPNGSLDNHLFGEQDEILSWDRRYNIISGVASAINYLHNEYDQKVVHRDLKASNIMLEPTTMRDWATLVLHEPWKMKKHLMQTLEAFLAQLGTLHQSVSILGSNVADWVWTLHRENRILEAVDERLGDDFNTEEAERLILLGLACSHPISGERPKPQTIVQIISGSVPAPYIPPFKPAFVWPMTEPTGDSSMTNTQDTTPMPSSYYGASQESNTGYSDLYTV
ncbi:hypothetical protein GIB67_025461 [Kingdonia uniflora]|uniref:Protein kinase domain-containing protein n=1 Tax=Kingdonia uniflora TaxID=39325 RepID=A0A7J7N1A6_9MAGN|nr:hypothetical protein GIB67_025461 [Kingdonia uniflora]